MATCCAKLLGLTTVFIPLGLLAYSIFDNSWSAMDEVLTGSGDDDVVVKLRMGMMDQHELVTVGGVKTYEQIEYTWCTGGAGPLPVDLQASLCSYLSITRFLTLGSFIMSLLVANMVFMAVFSCMKPRVVPFISGLSGFLCLLSGMAAAGAVGFWYMLVQNLQRGLHHYIPNVPQVEIPLNSGVIFQAAAAASSVVCGIFLFRLCTVARRDLARADAKAAENRARELGLVSEEEKMEDGYYFEEEQQARSSRRSSSKEERKPSSSTSSKSREAEKAKTPREDKPKTPAKKEPKTPKTPSKPAIETPKPKVQTPVAAPIETPERQTVTFTPEAIKVLEEKLSAAGDVPLTGSTMVPAGASQ
jgi:hypothetical protein